jgi:hypothetical protein
VDAVEALLAAAEALLAELVSADPIDAAELADAVAELAELVA